MMAMLRLLSATILLMLFSPRLYAADKLHLVIGFETGLERHLGADCKMRDLFFNAEDKNRNGFVLEARQQVKQMSKSLFGADDRIEVSFVNFSLEKVGHYLDAFITQFGSDALLPYQIAPDGPKKKSAGAYRKALTDIASADADRFKSDKKYGGIEVAKRCNTTTAQVLEDASQIQFARAMWRSESMRQLYLEDYLSLVFYYLRETSGLGGAESVVPVVIHPDRIWKIADEELKPAVQTLITDASLETGALQAALMAAIGNYVDYRTKGRTFVSKDLEQRGEYTNFVLRRRLGIVVGGYLVDAQASRRTLFHELGHYLGIAHVFTGDDTAGTGCEKKFSYGNSFWTQFEAARKHQHTQVLMCECFFVTKETKDFYADYDGNVTQTGDTPLAVKTEERVEYPNCIASDRYTKLFPKGDGNSRNNLMTYVGKVSNWSDYSLLTSDQKEMARNMLKSFD